MEDSNNVSREKYWFELNDSEKIERMRNVVKRLIQDIDKTESNVTRMRREFGRHSHHDGKIMTDFPEPFNYGNYPDEDIPNRRTENSNEVYF